MACLWDVIVLTCRDEHTAVAYEIELKARQSQGLISSETLLLTVADPASRVGSGGATLNALLVATERLSSMAGYTAVTGDVLNPAGDQAKAPRILIMHMGRDFPFDGCCRAFSSIPGIWNVNDGTHLAVTAVMCHIDFLLCLLEQRVCAGSPPGVWVCSSDMMLFVGGQEQTGQDWSSFSNGVRAVAIPGPVDYALRHGVYKLGSDGEVLDIIFRGDRATVDQCALPDGNVPLVSGVVFMCPETAEQLLLLQRGPPLENCTYLGIDSGNTPLNVSLFFDMLLALAKNVTREAYEGGSRSGAYGRGSALEAGSQIQVDEGISDLLASASDHPDPSVSDRRKARKVIWELLREHGVGMQAVVLHDLRHDYIDLRPLQHIERLQKLSNHEAVQQGSKSVFTFSPLTHCYLEDKTHVSDKAVMVCCLVKQPLTVKENSSMAHCRIDFPTQVGNRCLVNSVAFNASSCKGLSSPVCVPDDCCLVAFCLLGESRPVHVAFGASDVLEATVEIGTFMGETWNNFFQRTGIRSVDLWRDGERQSLFSARLFPVEKIEHSSLLDILWLVGSIKHTSEQYTRWKSSQRKSLLQILPHVDVEAEFSARSLLFVEVVVEVQRNALHQCKRLPWVAPFRSATRFGYGNKVLEMLDDVASHAESPGVRARALAGIADVLGAMAGDGTGLRSGPGGNRGWKSAYMCLETKRFEDGVRLLAAERRKWMGSLQSVDTSHSRPRTVPSYRSRELLRAARHYEGAAQILISQAVKTSEEFAKTEKVTDFVPMGKWVVAEAPARVDLAGGWSDTPPVTYEHGGSVVNVAILIKGKRPIGARVRRIKEPMLKLCLLSAKSMTPDVVIECRQLSDLRDYSVPTAKGALLKASFCCLKIVDIDSPVPLVEQLTWGYEGGFELQTWSNLPAGSGLGTSSILAGVVMAALLRSVGRSTDTDTLIHLVLIVEQMLTTGGGWQDQVGGLVGGFKIARSEAQLPLKVVTTHLELSAEVLEKFNRHFVVIYTGRTRLARNILQEVVRSWYGQLELIVKTADKLVQYSEATAKALVEGDIETIGRTMHKYWQAKKIMAHGSEPSVVAHFIANLDPYIYGTTMAGAGGGGFMYVLTKEPDTGKEIVERVIRETEEATGFEVYDAVLDPVGVCIRVED